MTTLETVNAEETAEEAAPALRPYKGLDFYTASDEDARLFVGRDTERKLIASNLIASRLTIVYGASGVGKSSLLNAGVAYQLRHDADLNERGTPEYVVVVYAAWRDDPVTGLVDAVAREVKNVLPGLVDRVAHDAPLAVSLREWGALLDGELLVILDQFEEFFLYHGDETDDAGFGAQFAEAIDDPAVHANFLVSIREDAFGRLDLFKDRIPNLFENCLRLDHLGLEAGRQAIERPLEEWNKLATTNEPVSIEAGLVDEVLEQVRTVEVGGEGLGTVDKDAPASPRTRIEAPYLQIVLTRLWHAERALNSNVLRLETLRALGGAQKIVDARVQEAMGSLTAEQQVIAAAVCHYLVSRTGTKIAFGAADLADFAGLQENEVGDVLEQLTKQKARILRPIAPPANQPGGTRYELFHDKLAKAILEWRASFLEQQARIEAEQQLKAEQAERQREVRNKFIRWAAVALVFVVVALVALSVVALHQRSMAAGARDDAQSRLFAAKAAEQLAIAPAVAVRLAARGMNLSVTDEAEQAFREALEASHLRAVLDGKSGSVYAASFSPDGKLVLTASEGGRARIWNATNGKSLRMLRGGGSVGSASFSPDGKRIVTTSFGGTVSVWDASGGQRLAAWRALGGPVLAASFSPDSKRIVTTSFGGTVSIWDASSGQRLAAWRALGGPVWAASFSPDGKRIVTVDEDLTARVWDAALGRSLAVLRGHTGRIYAASFSADGKRIVTASADKTARVWNAASGKIVAILRGHGGSVYAASFSPDGTLIVTASADRTARVWDAFTGKRGAILSGDTGPVYAASFSPDGKLIVTASADHTARVWEAADGKSVAMLGGDTGQVFAASFSRDGDLIVTASADGSARIWNVSSIPLLAKLDGSPTVASFSADGKLVVTASTDGTAQVWSVSTGKRLAILRGDGAAVLAASFSPDGNRVVAASADGTARVWDASNWHRLKLVRTQETGVSAAAFSPDDKRLVTGSIHGTARIWDASSGERLAVLRGQTGQISAVSFSADGKRVVAASTDGTARVWDASTGKVITSLGGGRANSVRAAPFTATSGNGAAVPIAAPPPGSAAAVRWAAFSPDGKLVVTASDDFDTRVWDASTGVRRATLTGDTASVSTAGFSSDGKLILTASADGTARVWETSTWRNLAILDVDSGPVFSASFDPNGDLIVTTNGNRTARIYSCRFCGSRAELALLVRHHVSR